MHCRIRQAFVFDATPRAHHHSLKQWRGSATQRQLYKGVSVDFYGLDSSQLEDGASKSYSTRTTRTTKTHVALLNHVAISAINIAHRVFPIFRLCFCST